MKGLLFLSLLISHSTLQPSNPLQIYRWEHRIVLIVAGDDPQSAKGQLNRFTDELDEVQDRDILVLTLKKDQVSVFDEESTLDSEGILNTYGLDRERFSVALIGKDGGIKFRSSEVVPPLQIYGLIDQMPMRRSEMRSRRN
ncbi:MAG: DUF4174 domain-containing protein [Bacteroidota bacterium]